MKECDILWGRQTYCDPYYIFFEGSSPRQPPESAPLYVREIKNQYPSGSFLADLGGLLVGLCRLMLLVRMKKRIADDDAGVAVMSRLARMSLRRLSAAISLPVSSAAAAAFLRTCI